MSEQVQTRDLLHAQAKLKKKISDGGATIAAILYASPAAAQQHACSSCCTTAACMHRLLQHSCMHAAAAAPQLHACIAYCIAAACIHYLLHSISNSTHSLKSLVTHTHYNIAAHTRNLLSTMILVSSILLPGAAVYSWCAKVQLINPNPKP